MTATLRVPVDRMTEPFRDKVIRKCGESMEMKEKFFVKYAEPLEVPSYSIHRIQKVHATAVHIVWDLVHMALGEEDVT
jgi:uncharacterized Zn finger protein